MSSRSSKEISADRQAHRALERINGEPGAQSAENGRWGLEVFLGSLVAGTGAILISFGGKGDEPQRYDAPLPDGRSTESDPTENNPYERLMQIYDSGGPQTEAEQQEFDRLTDEIYREFSDSAKNS